MHDEAHLAYLSPFHAGDGIEIDPKLVRMIEVFGAHRMRMKLDAGKIGEPGDCGSVARHDFVGAAA